MKRMKQSLESRLFMRFPEIFKERTKPYSESSMAFGICCGDGWFNLIWELCSDLEHIAKEENVPAPACTQVKEKIGQLRFYLRSGSNEMHKRIELAEDQSITICEKCGEPGQRIFIHG